MGYGVLALLMGYNWQLLVRVGFFIAELENKSWILVMSSIFSFCYKLKILKNIILPTSDWKRILTVMTRDIFKTEVES
jgi:hypothetical protein